MWEKKAFLEQVLIRTFIKSAMWVKVKDKWKRNYMFKFNLIFLPNTC